MTIAIIAAILSLLCACGCTKSAPRQNFPEIYTSLDLETRLSGVDFSLVESSSVAVTESWRALDRGDAVPDTWELDFSGSSITPPPIDPDRAIGLLHTDGRLSVVYPFPDIEVPAYGNIVPLAVAHYRIPDDDLDILLLLVCFQADPDGSLAGIGVRTVDTEGYGLSAPFALALRPEDLAGKFFYDDFLGSTASQMVAGRAGWDQGIMLVSRLAPDVILSTYIPWY